jgi:hypothetical protein
MQMVTDRTLAPPQIERGTVFFAEVFLVKAKAGVKKIFQ